MTNRPTDQQTNRPTDQQTNRPTRRSRKRDVACIEFTTKVGCPLNCRACPQSLFIKRYQEKRPWEATAPAHRTMMMSLEDFKTCVDKLPPDAQIHFSGFGEPQVNPVFADMVLYAHSTGRPVVLYSTFVGMTHESYERIRDVPFKSVTPHIPDRDSNSHFTLSPEYLELLNLVLADAAAGRFKVHGYSCHGTVHPAIAEIFTKNGLPTPRGRSFSELQDRSGNVKNPDVIHLSRKKGRLWCHATRLDFDHNVVLPDGTVCLCCQDFGMDHVLGNLITQSFDQIMEGDAVQNLRHLMKSEKNGDCLCRRCPIAESDFEYFVRSPLKRTISSIKGKVALRTRIKKLIKRTARHS